VFRALQAEILASSIYTRILMNDTLREQLRTETRVEGFWRSNETRRRALYGEPIDLHAATHAQFFSAHVDPLDIV